MIHYFKSSKVYLALYILFAPISILCSLGFIFTFQSIIDIAGNGSLDQLKRIALIALVITLADMGFCLLLRYLKKIILRNALIALKEDTITNILSSSLSTFSSTNSSEYISLLNNDIRIIEQSYFNNLLSLYHQVINLIIYTIAALLIHPIVAVIILIGALISLRIPHLFGTKLERLQNNYSSALATYTIYLKDILSGFQVVKTFNLESHVLKRHKDTNNNLESYKTTSEYYNYGISWLSGNITQMMYIFILLVGAYYVLQGELTVGLIIALTELIGGIVAPIEFITTEITELRASSPIVGKFKNILNRSNTILHTSTPSKPIDAVTLSLNNLSFSYDSTKDVLKNIHLTFEKGKKYAIVGDSGSGKSTLIKLLLGLYDDYKGNIMINENCITHLTKHVLYQNITVVSQDLFIFDDTFRNNICLFSAYSEDAIRYALKMSQLDCLVSKLPNGLDTILNENGHILSGGEKQRIGIARALLRKSNFIILDEATSNLDNKTSYTIENNILSLKEVGCISIMHRLNPHILKEMDEIIVLKNGALEEKGSFDDLIARKTYFYTLYELYQK